MRSLNLSKSFAPVLNSLALAFFGCASISFAAVAAVPVVSGIQFDGAALNRTRANQIATAGGFELIDFHPCTSNSAGCAQFAVRKPNGLVRLYTLVDRPCTSVACFAGYAIRSQQHERQDVAAKVSAAPGDDGAPPDPEDEAQAEATNEIIEALGDGKYEGEYDKFWSDLESIQTWDNPTWYEPDPLPPNADEVRITGIFGNESPAILVSGRFENDDGSNECRRWVSYGSDTNTIDLLGDWLGNAPFDGCDSEVAVFSENGAAMLMKPEGRWSNGEDELTYAPADVIKVPTSVWVIYSRVGYAAELERLKDDFEFANDTLSTSKCGIEVAPQYFDRTHSIDNPTQSLGCGEIETKLKQAGYHEDKMNVYIVNSLARADRAGVACTAESDNVIILDSGRRDSSLVHEYGHWFDLSHTNTTDMPLVNVRNVMSRDEVADVDMLTAGQCYRANFSKDSYINVHKLRSGKTKNCKHLQDADNQCPGLKNEF